MTETSIGAIIKLSSVKNGSDLLDRDVKLRLLNRNMDNKVNTSDNLYYIL